MGERRRGGWREESGEESEGGAWDGGKESGEWVCGGAGGEDREGEDEGWGMVKRRGRWIWDHRGMAIVISGMMGGKGNS